MRNQGLENLIFHGSYQSQEKQMKTKSNQCDKLVQIGDKVTRLIKETVLLKATKAGSCGEP